MIVKPFNPKWGSNQVVSATSPAALITIDGSNESVRVYNSGATNKGYVRIYRAADYAGISAPVASAADYPIGPNMASVITKAVGDDTLSYFSAAGTTLEVMTGSEGV